MTMLEKVRKLVEEDWVDYVSNVDVTAHPNFPKVKAVRLMFKSFLRSDGQPISFWLTARKRGFNISDAAQFVQRQPDLNLMVLSEIVSDYDCNLMENFSIMETTTKGDIERISSFLQCLVVIEGITRVWRRQEKQVDTGTPHIDSSEDQEATSIGNTT